jgi:hypothetical protein
MQNPPLNRRKDRHDNQLDVHGETVDLTFGKSGVVRNRFQHATALEITVSLQTMHISSRSKRTEDTIQEDGG